MTTTQVAPAHGTRNVLTGARKTAVVFILIFLTISALVGIIALFTGEWSDTQAKIIATTLLFATFSIIFLVLITIFERIGIFAFWLDLIVAGITLIATLITVWYAPPFYEGYETYYNVMGKIIILGALYTVYLMHCTLIFLMHKRSHISIKVTVAVTFILGTLLTVYFSIATFNDAITQIPEIGRFIAAFLILIVLGTIALPILGRVIREPALGSRITSVELPAGIIQILRKRASEKNLSIPELLGQLLNETDANLTSNDIITTMEEEPTA